MKMKKGGFTPWIQTNCKTDEKKLQNSEARCATLLQVNELAMRPVPQVLTATDFS